MENTTTRNTHPDALVIGQRYNIRAEGYTRWDWAVEFIAPRDHRMGREYLFRSASGRTFALDEGRFEWEATR